MQLDKERCVILAAGDGGRTRAAAAICLREVAFKPVVAWVADAVQAAGIEQVRIVANDAAMEKTRYRCILTGQGGRLSTGQAVLRAGDFLQPGGNTLVLYGDAPFIDAATIAAAYRLHLDENNDATVVTCAAGSPGGNPPVRHDGLLYAVVPSDDDCDDELLTLPETDAGVCWFKTDTLLASLDNSDTASMDDLGDIIMAITAAGGLADRYTVFDMRLALRADSAGGLLRLNEEAAATAIQQHLQNGVLFVSRDGVVIGPDVAIGAGTAILPGTLLSGATKIGKDCVIGPNTVLNNTVVGDNCAVNSSQLADSALGAGVTLGPYSQLRPGCTVGDGVKIGDFVEIKNSSIGEGTSVAHLTYIGDADVGRHCNFGCGVVFVNYDGESKNRTTIGDYAFIGCNTNLIAPVSVGEGAYTAAGTTVSKDVPAGAMAIGRVDQQNKPEWATKKLAGYIDKKKI